MSELGDEILEGLEDAIAYARGDTQRAAEVTVYIPDHVDVRTIRKKLSLSQERFARKFGFSVSAVRNWEQGRRTPEAPIRAFLMVIDKAPQAVLGALHAEQ